MIVIIENDQDYTSIEYFDESIDKDEIEEAIQSAKDNAYSIHGTMIATCTKPGKIYISDSIEQSEEFNVIFHVEQGEEIKNVK